MISNPLRTRIIAEAKLKIDKIYARVLTELLRADYDDRRTGVRQCTRSRTESG